MLHGKISKYKIIYFSSIILFLISVQALAKDTLFQKAENLYLSSFETQENKSISQSRKEKTLTIEPPTLLDQRAAVFNLFNNAESNIGDQVQLDPIFLKKMEIFLGGEKLDNHLFNIIQHTNTITGEANLVNILIHPTTNVELLKTRQAITKELLDNQELQNELHNVLTEIKETEPLFLSYFVKENKLNEELFKKIYFPSLFKKLNKSSLALEIKTRFNHALLSLNTLSSPAIFACAAAQYKYMNAKKSGNPISVIKALQEGFKSTWQFFSFKQKTYKNKSITQVVQEQAILHGPHWQNNQNAVQAMMPQTFGDLSYILDHINTLDKSALPMSPALIKATIFGYGGLIAGITCFNGYKSWEEIKLKKDVANHLQTQLISVSRYMNAFNKLLNLTEQHPLLKQLIENQNLSFMHDKELIDLLNQLNSNTFQGEASFFSMTGKVLAAHTSMKELKDKFIPIMNIVGTIDAHLSIAKLYQAHQQMPARYNFVEFINAHKPIIKAVNFWNPFINPNVVVSNSIELGHQKPNNIILTGPNTGGKSTVIKGLIFNILLAQSFGIAPAERLTITPFTSINCYLNITDDITAGTSLFQAEVLRAKTLIENIRNLKAGQFSFTIMDEVFSGTSPKEGEDAALRYAEQLGNFENSICSIATHFGRLTELEKKTSSYKNYQVKVFKNELGKWVRPFRLEEGKSTLNIAMELLEAEGIF
ncbi:MAG: hypothetical protein WDZ41_01810 [Candidatus Babeliales bacterium]